MSTTGRALAATVVAGALAALLAATDLLGPGAGTRLPGATAVGVLEPTVENAPRLVEAGVERATLAIGWDAFEPERGVVDRAYVARQRARVAAWREAGYDVVLDPGLQYPPAWVVRLPGARFVDQDGRPWRGRSSEDVPDPVWNQRVREAQERHLRNLADALGADSFVAVRVGGLLSGELRLPPATSGGAGGRLWGYSAAARAQAPSDWRPGAGTPAQALRWLTWYCDSLSRYGGWLTRTTADAFPGLELQVLFPGWGLRPGDLRAAAEGLGGGTTVAERGDTVAGGLDWPGQLDELGAVRDAGVDVVVHSTWLDAPGTPGDPRSESPPTWLFSLASERGLDLGGENTGGGGAPALARAARQARAWDLRSVTWLSEEALLEPGAAVTPAELVDAVG